MKPEPRALPSLWTVRTPSGARTCRREGDRFVPAATPWLGERLALLRLFVTNDFRSRYRAQALGLVWSLLQPLVMTGILSVVFTQVFKARNPNYPIVLLIGLVVWQWVSAALNAGTISFVANADMVKRTVFPRALLPLSAVFSYGINAAVESLVVLVLVPFFPGALKLTPALLVIPLLIGCLIVLLSGIAVAVSVLNVIYRDVAYLVTTSLMLLYWLTPVVYSPDIIPERWRVLFGWNPIGGVITGIRGALLDGVVPTAFAWLQLCAPILVVAAFGAAIYRAFEHEMLDHV